MRKSAFEPCIPTWAHGSNRERLDSQEDGQCVRLFTRNGHDWSGRFPPITETALRSRNSSFVLDGEAVPLGVNDISDFNGLHTCRRRGRMVRGKRS
jgi:bifunctional non-homologous end joining protein LigD